MSINLLISYTQWPINVGGQTTMDGSGLQSGFSDSWNIHHWWNKVKDRIRSLLAAVACWCKTRIFFSLKSEMADEPTLNANTFTWLLSQPKIHDSQYLVKWWLLLNV